MFRNIGGKIKATAEVGCILGIIISVIYGIFLIVQSKDAVIPGIAVILLGSLSSWVGAFFTYGLGQLIENTDILVQSNCVVATNTDRILEKEKEILTAIDQLDENDL